MFESLRSLKPRTVLDVKTHIQFAKAPENYQGYYQKSPEAGNYAWSPFDNYGWFEATKKMAGREAKLTTKPNEYQVGTLDERAIGHLTIGDVSFYYDATAEAAQADTEIRDQTLTVVSAGVLRYLEGFDQQGSDDVQARVEGAIAEQKRRDAVMMREFLG